MSTSDSHFDNLAEHFADKIYNSAKGQIRLALLQLDLANLQQKEPLRILDAGGGQGHISRWFAEADHQISLCDTSKPMLEKARQLNHLAGVSDKIRLHDCDIDTFCQDNSEHFDLVLCHAVLEWAEQPYQLVCQLANQLKPGGHLSLMFYNRHSLILRNALRGNLRKVKRGDWSGDGNSLTPHQSLDPEEVYGWLQQNSMQLIEKSGIRCFYDYLPLKVKQTYDFEDILELERNHYQQQPYIHMARYIHVIATRL